MSKTIKKIISMLLCFLMVLSITGCSSISVKDGESSSSGSSEIPKNGIISESVFQEIMDNGEMAIFNGKNDEFTYQWMFMGSDISSPRDLNLLINSANSKVKLVKEKSNSDKVYGFKFEEETNLDSKTAISITYKDSLDCTSADVYQVEDGELKKVTTANVDTSEGTTFNFNIKERKGEFYIVGSDPKKAAIDNLSDGEGSSGVLDKYSTEATPAGKPKPFEWNESGNKVDKNIVAGYCTLFITCKTLLDPANKKVIIANGKGDMVPSNGVIYKTKKVKFYKNETVFDVLLRETRSSGIHMEYVMTPVYNSNYIEGINNIYEFDGGNLSGWMYSVNGWFPNYGCSRYKLKDGDSIKWVYTCDLGRDVGDTYYN